MPAASPRVGIDLGKKLSVYRGFGVANLWFLDPAARTLEVLRQTERGWLIVVSHRDADKVRVEPFDAVELELGLLWDVPEENKDAE